MMIKIGKDDFCIFCMDWREFDEQGRCKTCKNKIKQYSDKQKDYGYNEYKTESPSFEIYQDSEE